MTRAAAWLLLVLLSGCDAREEEAGVPYATPLPPEGANPRPALKPYVNNFFRLRMQVPAEWEVKDTVNSADDGFSDGTAFLKLTALGGPRTIDEACATEAGHRMMPYGPDPRIERITIDGQPACRITPSDGYAVQKRIPAGIIVEYPRPIAVPAPPGLRNVYAFGVVWVDVPHLPVIEGSLRFIR